MGASRKDISRLISYWLRHNPQDGGLSLDEFGWVELDKILTAFRNKNIALNLEGILELNRSFDKVRWEIDVQKNRIRATHGHSLPVMLDERVAVPPEILFHGTSSDVISKIISTGLLPMNRHFVHLSENIKNATAIGKRHGKPFIIEVNTQSLILDGWKFYKTSDDVWLTSEIPSHYLSFEPWYPAVDQGNYFIDELIREIGNRKTHFLYRHLDDLELVWNTGICDDALYADKKTGKVYVVHLTYTGRPQEIDGWPEIQVYDSIDDWIQNGLWTDQQDYYDFTPS